MSVTYTAVLDVSEDSVLFLSGLLHAERVRRGTRTDSRALGTYRQAVLVLRWLFDDTQSGCEHWTWCPMALSQPRRKGSPDAHLVFRNPSRFT
jgi:hypothetical protein